MCSKVDISQGCFEKCVTYVMVYLKLNFVEHPSVPQVKNRIMIDHTVVRQNNQIDD